MNGLVTGIQAASIEWSILHTLNDFLFHHDGVEDPLLVFVNASEALFVGILLLVFLFANGESHRAWRRATVAAVLSAGVALALAKVLSEIVDRSRPFVVDPSGVHLFSGHAADPGFPSDHAVMAGAVVAGLFLVDRRLGWVAAAAAALMAFSRLYIAAHYPLDVVVGLLLGAAVSLAGYFLLRRVLLRLVLALQDTRLRPLLTTSAQGVGS